MSDTQPDDEVSAEDAAFAATETTVQASMTIEQYAGEFAERLDSDTLMSRLYQQIDELKSGNTAPSEAMLMSQACTLDAMFHHLSRRAIKSRRMDHLEGFLKLALRAQSQCRATMEAVSTIKNPPLVGYARQANITQGPQQVNNITQPVGIEAQQTDNPQNELLEVQDGQRVDAGATSTAGDVDTPVEAVGAIHRAGDEGR